MSDIATASGAAAVAALAAIALALRQGVDSAALVNNEVFVCDDGV